MNNSDLIRAITTLGIATPREIFDFVGTYKPMNDEIEIDVIERILNQKKINYFFTDEWFAKKRYTLSQISGSTIIKPRIFIWPFEPLEMIDFARQSIREKKIILINNSEPIRELYPDYERYVIYCIESKKYLDGVIDLKIKTLAKKYRFPTILYNTPNHSKISEWKRACQTYSKYTTDIIPLKIREVGS